jgi:hypothetical protein
MKITLGTLDPKNDIVRLISSPYDVLDWLKFDEDKSVYVCFEKLHELKDQELRDEYPSLLITRYSEDVIGKIEDVFDDLGKNGELFVFNFESYQEALKYLIDLKEGY